MYARTTTVHGDPGNLDRGIAHVRDEVLPAVQEMEGCVGLSMLVDRTSGRCIVTTAWESEEAMHATSERVRAMRERAAEMLGGRPDVREWEIAVLHRAHEVGDGACARVTWTRTDPSNVERVLDGYRTHLMPRLHDMPGFCSNSLLVNRQEGLGAGALVLDSREAMDSTREQAAAMREQFAQSMGVDILEVAEFDVAVAHLRVPETV